MRKIPITITLPESLIRDLHSYIHRRQLSKCISKAVSDELEHEKLLSFIKYHHLVYGAQDEGQES